MKKPVKKVRERKPPRKFIDRFEDQLRNIDPIGDITRDKLSDRSSEWVQIETKTRKLVFEFDQDGNLSELGFFKKVYQVVDEKKLFGS